MRTRLIVNPTSDQGHTLAVLPHINGILGQLSLDFDVVQTEAPGHAVDLTRQAVAEGVERVVAVGGDGTCNEVANGLISIAAKESPAILGLIPSGSGNDWAVALGIPLDIALACAVLKNGSAHVIDMGRVTVDGTVRFFVNMVGLGLDAEVAQDTRRTTWLRGSPRYLLSVFKVLVAGQWPYPTEFCYNGQQRQQSLVLIAVGNGTRAGGGFLLTPEAKMDDGLFDICHAAQMSRLSLLNLLPKTLKGTHIFDPKVTMARSDKIVVMAANGIPGHIDGETLCVAGRRFEFEILPGALRVWK
jgi:YegS/Rv2252/BmrU family lipid kinase